MNLRDHIFALSVHGGILIAICVLVLITSCQKPPVEKEPDPVGDFFKQFQDGLDIAGAESITVIAVDDNIGAGQNLQRQVFQEIQVQIYRLETASILEYPTSELEAIFLEMDIVPSDGISPEDVIELSERLSTHALLYASIESKEPDVHIKLYSGMDGTVVFAETLSKWPLPVSQPEDLFGEMPDTSSGIPIESEQPTESTE